MSFDGRKSLNDSGFSNPLDATPMISADMQSIHFELPIEHDYISDFIDGYGVLEKDGKWTLVDKDYNTIFSTSEYEVNNIYDDILCVKYIENSKYGLIDINGNIIAAPQYDTPIIFSEGLAMVERNGRVGYLNTEGQEIIKFDFIWGCPFRNGLAAVGVDENYFYFINTKGEMVSGPFEDLGSEVYSHMLAYMEYSEGYTAFFEENQKEPAVPYGNGHGSWGFMDKQGNVAIRPEYLFVRPFHEGLAAVQTKEGRWIYINQYGKKVMDGAPGDFFKGMACIGERFIDKSGNTMLEIPKEYSVAVSEQKGFDNFYFGDFIVVFNELVGHYAIMNRDGEIIMEANDYQEIKIFNENNVAVKKDEQWGIISIR